MVSLLSSGVRKMEFDSIPNAYRPYKTYRLPLYVRQIRHILLSFTYIQLSHYNLGLEVYQKGTY